MFLLDTDHLVILQRRADPEWTNLRSRLTSVEKSSVFLSIVSFHEQMLGANAYISKAKNFSDIVRGYQMMEESLIDFGRFRVLPFDQPAASVFDQLRQQKLRVGTMDLRIASIALSHGFEVATRNTNDFGKVPGLTVEDWTLPLG